MDYILDFHWHMAFYIVGMAILQYFPTKADHFLFISWLNCFIAVRVRRLVDEFPSKNTSEASKSSTQSAKRFLAW